MVKFLYSGCGQVGWERCLSNSVSLLTSQSMPYVRPWSLPPPSSPPPGVGDFSFKLSLPHPQPLSSGFADSKTVSEEKKAHQTRDGCLGCRRTPPLILLGDLGTPFRSLGLSPCLLKGRAGSGDLEVLPGLAAFLGDSCCMPACRLADLPFMLDSPEDSQVVIPVFTLHLLIVNQVYHGNSVVVVVMVVVVCVFPKTLVGFHL